MKTIKTTVVTLALSLISTSAFAGSEAVATPAQFSEISPVSTPTRHVVKPAVLIDAAPHTNRRIVRVVKEPIEAPVARDASMSADSHFVYKYGKNTNSKTYRPVTPKSASMPNLFKK